MTVTTGTVAKLLGVHPNTLRWYETADYLPPIPRTPGGYRQYSTELVRLARVVRESQPLLRLYGAIRTVTFTYLGACKEDCVALQNSTPAHTGDDKAGPGPYSRTFDHLNALERFAAG